MAMMNTSARHRISGTLRQLILSFDSLKTLSGLTPYLDRLIHGHHVSTGRIPSHGHFGRDDLLACCRSRTRKLWPCDSTAVAGAKIGRDLSNLGIGKRRHTRTARRKAARLRSILTHHKPPEEFHRHKDPSKSTNFFELTAAR
jgi:hypothetical protein